MSRITEKVVAEMPEWATPPLDAVYVAVFIDAIMVKVRDGQVANRPVYAAIGVTIEGCKDVLGLWAGRRRGRAVLDERAHRPEKPRCQGCVLPGCDGLKGLPEVVANVWPLAIVQTCIIHLIRNTFRLTSRRDSDAIKRDIKPSIPRLLPTRRPRRWTISNRNGVINMRRHPAVAQCMERIHSVPRLRHRNKDGDLLHECDRISERPLPAAVGARGHFPSEQAALKCLYLVTRSLDPTGTGRTRWTMRWKPVINAFAITFGDRWPAAETY